MGFSQPDSLWTDSVQEKATVFFAKVDKIEVIKLEPYCVTKRYPIGWFGRMKDVLSCYESSIIRYSEDADSLACPIDTSHIAERYTLQPTEFESLFEMLYDGEPANNSAACYNPRHGIIFYDSSEKIIGFLEICFECHRMYALPDTPNIGPIEGDAFWNLKLFFEERGL